MRGHVRKRGNKWCFVITVGSEGGTARRQKWHSGYATKKQAEAALTKTLSDIQAGTYVEPSRLSVAAFFEQWLDTAGGTVRPGTLRSYTTNIELHVIARIGDVALAKLTPVRLNALYADLLRSGRHDGTGGLSTRTVRYTHAIIHRALKDAVRWGLLQRNPADFADPPRHERPEMQVWTAEELRRFLAATSTDELSTLWLLLATTGMRRGEALGLRWQDVDLGAGRASVQQTLSSLGGELLISPPKTPKSRRSLSLDPVTVGALRSHRRLQAETMLAVGRRVDGSGLVFTRQDGTPVRPDSASRRFVELARATGLPQIRLHDLRHTYATIALAAGTHPKVVAERLGHAQTMITLDTYSHVLPSIEAEAASRIAGLILNARPEATPEAGQ